jgi:hypothetical protein
MALADTKRIKFVLAALLMIPFSRIRRVGVPSWELMADFHLSGSEEALFLNINVAAAIQSPKPLGEDAT